MLGLGDIVMPGLLLCFVMRYDAYKRAQVIILKLQRSRNIAYCYSMKKGETNSEIDVSNFQINIYRLNVWQMPVFLFQTIGTGSHISIVLCLDIS